MEVKRKLFGVINYVNEAAGYCFVTQRQPGGERKSWFCHVSRIDEGTMQKGARCYFDEEFNERGPLAVNVIIRDVVPKFADNAAVKVLAEKTDIDGAE